MAVEALSNWVLLDALFHSDDIHYSAEALFVSYIFSYIPIFVKQLPGIYTFTCIYVIIHYLNSVFILEGAALSICYEPFWAAHVMHASPVIQKLHEAG